MTPASTTKCHVTTWQDAVRAEAYLLTIMEAKANDAAFGAQWMSHVTLAFGSPATLRHHLPTGLRARYDWWVSKLERREHDRHQLSLFDLEDMQ